MLPRSRHPKNRHSSGRNRPKARSGNRWSVRFKTRGSGLSHPRRGSSNLVSIQLGPGAGLTLAWLDFACLVATLLESAPQTVQADCFCAIALVRMPTSQSGSTRVCRFIEEGCIGRPTLCIRERRTIHQSLYHLGVRSNGRQSMCAFSVVRRTTAIDTSATAAPSSLPQGIKCSARDHAFEEQFRGVWLALPVRELGISDAQRRGIRDETSLGYRGLCCCVRVHRLR